MLLAKPVRLGKVGNLYVPERDSEIVVELVEPIRGYRYAVLRKAFPAYPYDGYLLIPKAFVICLLPEPW